MTIVSLGGCRAEPLSAYLKGLGLLRLVSEQVDLAATGWWERDVWHLDSSLDGDALITFLLEGYVPTPVIAPWNRGGGFELSKKPGKGEKAIRDCVASSTTRLGPVRETIAAAQRVVATGRRRGWSPTGDEKALWVQECRNHFPDSAIAWLDAVVVLAEGFTAFAPLGGSGGNIGRLDLSINYLEHVLFVTDPLRHTSRRDPRRALAEHAVFGTGSPRLTKGSMGQFDPGAVDEKMNPWDMVLLIEGALLFAAGAARRLSFESAGRSAIPFTVNSTHAGYGSAATETSKGELWAPLWGRPATLPEIARLLGEGRASWRGSQARAGLDFARAARSLGTDRGIDSFVRYAFVERLGQSILAVPIGRVRVQGDDDVPMLAQLDRWLELVRWHGREVPSVTAAAARVVDRQYAIASGGALPASLQDVLIAAADLEDAAFRSLATRKDAPDPLMGILASDWLPALDDGSPEFRLAAALASREDHIPRGTLTPYDRTRSRAAFLLRPVEFDATSRLTWTSKPGPRTASTGPHVVRLLADLLVRRCVDVGGRQEPEAAEVEGPVGIDVG